MIKTGLRLAEQFHFQQNISALKSGLDHEVWDQTCPYFVLSLFKICPFSCTLLMEKHILLIFIIILLLIFVFLFYYFISIFLWPTMCELMVTNFTHSCRNAIGGNLIQQKIFLFFLSLILLVCLLNCSIGTNCNRPSTP